MTLLLVALAGGVGAATRFVLGVIVSTRQRGAFPLATVAINVSGSALIGLLTGGLLFHDLDPTVYLVLAVGFCGGYTTFSTAMVETVRLLQTGERRRAVANLLVSLLASLAAAAAGIGLLWLMA
ncbi:fluoride efflux transporter CrcB [Actinotalea sp. C106]|uniref:fluoride efflux transporter CrcB n=1 Tax=Actinotalea sp. C106 TaxID=2908644 RepID=UPI00202890AF|nr:fluoride efflux transporter CrcB [Actinotalea sp. C106]